MSIDFKSDSKYSTQTKKTTKKKKNDSKIYLKWRLIFKISIEYS